MREIKFRVWDKETKNICEVRNIDFISEMVQIKYQANYGVRELENVILMQFTGLQDKNGVDIYEGDILIYQHMFVDKKSVSEVIWNEKYSGFASYVEDDERRYILEKELKNQFEVIGNIYENPELLEV